MRPKGSGSRKTNGAGRLHGTHVKNASMGSAFSSGSIRVVHVNVCCATPAAGIGMLATPECATTASSKWNPPTSLRGDRAKATRVHGATMCFGHCLDKSHGSRSTPSRQRKHPMSCSTSLSARQTHSATLSDRAKTMVSNFECESVCGFEHSAISDRDDLLIVS